MQNLIETQTPKISVIIPVYNVQEYLVKCLDSVTNQTLKDIEIICINDGSTDLSLEILKGYEQTDRRIKIIDKKNEGQGIARNIGIQMARGKYIGFVDPDDWIDSEMYEKMYNQAEELSSEIVISDYLRYQSWTGKKWVPVFFEEAVSYTEAQKLNIPVHENINKYMINKTLLISPCYAWNRLYKREFLIKNKINFDEIRCYEDVNFILKSHILASNISYINEPLYIYRLNLKSSLYGNEDRYVLFFEIYHKIKQQLIKMNIFNELKLNLSYFGVMNTYWTYNNLSNPAKLRLIKSAKKNLSLKEFSIFMNKIGKAGLLSGIQKILLRLKNIKVDERKSLLKKIARQQKNTSKDLYILYDCLYDYTSECIDAYSLFQYMQSNNVNSIYVVLEKSSLYKKLKEKNNLKNVIVLRNKFLRGNEYEFLNVLFPYLVRTKCIISSFGENSSFIADFFKNNLYITYIFLQHGVTFLKEEVFDRKYITNEIYDKILISCDIEENIMKQHNISEHLLIKSGFPRYDLLNEPHDNEKSILIMLTWRQLSAENFEKSLYKKRLVELLENKKLINYARRCKTKIYFAPHHALSNNLKLNFFFS